MRRRARFLRKARELAYRDLGGLVFNLHRFGQRNDALVIAKLSTLGHIDAELRTLETDLRERQGVTVLREAGITACARCAAIHSSEDRFCPNCGLSLGPHPDLPIAGAAAAPAGVHGSQSPATPAPRAPEPAGAAGPASTPAAARPTPAATVAAPKTKPAPVPAGGRSAATTSEAPAEASSDEDEPTEIIRPPSGR